MNIVWSPDHAAFIVSVPELPGCLTAGSTYSEAVWHGEAAIEGWLEAARAEGLSIPQPKVYFPA